MATSDMQFQMDEAKSKMFNKAAADRAAADEAREIHEMNEQIRAEAKQNDLVKLMEGVPATEQRRIRLEAAILMYADRGSINGNQKQLQLDDIALELARYSITGSV